MSRCKQHDCCVGTTIGNAGMASPMVAHGIDAAQVVQIGAHWLLSAHGAAEQAWRGIDRGAGALDLSELMSARALQDGGHPAVRLAIPVGPGQPQSRGPCAVGAGLGTHVDHAVLAAAGGISSPAGA
jgi:hypothetical protein